MMWDYGAFPLWNVQANDPRVDVDELPLSPRLRAQLQAWSDARTDGASYTDNWRRRDRSLLARVRDELGPDFVVGCFGEKTRRVSWP